MLTVGVIIIKYKTGEMAPYSFSSFIYLYIRYFS